jgi:hypothetical protein
VSKVIGFASNQIKGHDAIIVELLLADRRHAVYQTSHFWLSP